MFKLYIFLLAFLSYTDISMAYEKKSTRVENPNYGPDQWRFIPHLGWYKFAPIDAYYYDYNNFKRISRPRGWRLWS
jgi:hypothetical protein